VKGSSKRNKFYKFNASYVWAHSNIHICKYIKNAKESKSAPFLRERFDLTKLMLGDYYNIPWLEFIKLIIFFICDDGIIA